MLGAGQGHNGKPMRKRGEVLLELVRRPARGDEVLFVEIESPVGCAGHVNMATVNGIERAAKKGDAARIVFDGGAVRLRYRQCVSQEFSNSDFLMNSRLRQRCPEKGQVWQRPAEVHDRARYSLVQQRLRSEERRVGEEREARCGESTW